MNTYQPKTAIRISQVKTIISDFSNQQPFSLYLKSYFKEHKQLGSKDRRQAQEWCIAWWRLGAWITHLSFETRLAVAVSLSNDDSANAKDLCQQQGIEIKSENQLKYLEAKFERSYQEAFSVLINHLSNALNPQSFAYSHLSQPSVYVRILNNKSGVIGELELQNIDFEIITEQTLRIIGKAQLTDLKSFTNGSFIIQDLNSQKTGEYMPIGAEGLWWDCCAGAGGKSILFLQQNPNAQIFATDNRNSILKNYHERLEQCGFDQHAFMKLDVSQPIKKGLPQFNGVIADVPCSGSGTWRRSPEHLSFFNPAQIAHFQELQRDIVTNTIPFLKENGSLIYITCSVFKEENEEQLAYFESELGLKCESFAVLNGAESLSDTLFCAVLKKEKA
ncbi:MAG: hypothetical protein KDC92_03940 [Bacteroidetes bacterium]|nr:hypothetical protein [Bacteroidota bacterium]